MDEHWRPVLESLLVWGEIYGGGVASAQQDADTFCGAGW